MYCPKCTVENPDHANFCFKCGEKINKTTKVVNKLERKEATLYAFLAQAKNYGVPGFVGKQVLMTPRSPDEYVPKIREKTGCPNSEVVIIEPEEWNPPEFSAISQEELTEKFPLVMARVQNKFRELELPYIGEQELIRNGTVMPNVASGKIIFIFKIPG